MSLKVLLKYLPHLAILASLLVYAYLLFIGNYEYVVKATTKSGTVGGTAVEVSVKVLYNAKDFKIGKVYVSGGTYSSSSYQSKVDAGLAANYATGGKDAIAGATESSTLIFEAVKAAVADVVVE